MDGSRCAQLDRLTHEVTVVPIVDLHAQTTHLNSMLGILAEMVSRPARECRVEAPYAPMRPVLTSEGVRWCCTHHPEHCASC